MLTPRLTNCQDCYSIPDLLKKIDCKLAELGNDMYNNISFMLGNDIPATTIMQLMAYKRILTFKYCNPHYAGYCSVDDIADKVIHLTSGCVSKCNEPTVCEITTCCVDIIPNPTTTTTSTSSTSTSTTTSTSTSSTTTTTTTINCTFTGIINCPVTTTTTTTPEPTTTTTTVYPGVTPCIWSTNGGNPGQIAVYDFDTNSSIAVLIPNDFLTTQGINRPICSTGDKLWMASVVENTVDPNNNTYDVVYIREWNINTTEPTPTLSYVREITILTGNLNYKNTWGTTVSSIAVTADNNTLLVGFGAKNSGTNSMGVYSWNISTAGNITLNESNRITKQQVEFGGTYGVVTELTGIFITNNNNVIVSARYYEDTSSINAGNYIKEYIGLPPVGGTIVDWISASYTKPCILLQSIGISEFTNTWTNPNKAMPIWGVNGLLQVIQPETLNVYNISQTPNYDATLVNTVTDNNVWIYTSTGCANIEILNQDEINNCTPTVLPVLVESNGSNYIGPITFTYSGMSVIASSNIIGGLLSSEGEGYTTNCGITIPSSTQVMYGNTNGATLNTPAFSYTLEFPIPVNNIALRTAILNPLDDFRFTTNATSTTITIVEGCRANVQNGNELITDFSVTAPNEGSVEIAVTGSEDFTTLTFVGTNKGNGGPWALGCTPNVNTTTTTLIPTTTITTTLPSGVSTIWTWFESETIPV